MTERLIQDPAAGTTKGGALRRLWRFLRRPSGTISVGLLLIVGGIGGVVFWGGFNWSMELTNTQTFCISCHEMEQNVFQEYRNTVHFSNRTGVRATCPDCHVPKDWIHKVARKIQATNELYHHFLGTIDTREAFDAKRIELATNVWRAMKKTDSRECRNCHNFEYMDYTKQESRAATRHEEAISSGMTCIDCHQGVAHNLPPEAFDAFEELKAEMKAQAGN
jgi:cytochrome c-type protein NapC